MADWISLAIGAIFVAIENVVLFLCGKKKGSKSERVRIKRIVKQEKKVAKDYQRLKTDESLLEELKKGGDE